MLVLKIDKGPISNGDGWDCSSDKYRVNAKSFYIKTKGENAGQIVSMPLPGYFGRIAVTAPQAFDIAAGVWTQWVDVKATCQDVTDDEYLNYLRRHLPVNSALVLAMNDDDFNDAMVQFYILQDAKEASSEWGDRDDEGEESGPIFTMNRSRMRNLQASKRGSSATIIKKLQVNPDVRQLESDPNSFVETYLTAFLKAYGKFAPADLQVFNAITAGPQDTPASLYMRFKQYAAMLHRSIAPDGKLPLFEALITRTFGPLVNQVKAAKEADAFFAEEMVVSMAFEQYSNYGRTRELGKLDATLIAALESEHAAYEAHKDHNDHEWLELFSYVVTVQGLYIKTKKAGGDAAVAKLRSSTGPKAARGADSSANAARAILNSSCPLHGKQSAHMLKHCSQLHTPGLFDKAMRNLAGLHLDISTLVSKPITPDQYRKLGIDASFTLERRTTTQQSVVEGTANVVQIPQQASRGPPRAENQRYAPRDGDWVCSCGAVNKASRTVCFREKPTPCNKPRTTNLWKPDAASGAQASANSAVPPPEGLYPGATVQFAAVDNVISSAEREEPSADPEADVRRAAQHPRGRSVYGGWKATSILQDRDTEGQANIVSVVEPSTTRAVNVLANQRLPVGFDVKSPVLGRTSCEPNPAPPPGRPRDSASTADATDELAVVEMMGRLKAQERMLQEMCRQHKNMLQQLAQLRAAPTPAIATPQEKVTNTVEAQAEACAACSAESLADMLDALADSESQEAPTDAVTAVHDTGGNPKFDEHHGQANLSQVLPKSPQWSPCRVVVPPGQRPPLLDNQLSPGYQTYAVSYENESEATGVLLECGDLKLLCNPLRGTGTLLHDTGASQLTISHGQARALGLQVVDLGLAILVAGEEKRGIIGVAQGNAKGDLLCVTRCKGTPYQVSTAVEAFILAGNSTTALLGGFEVDLNDVNPHMHDSVVSYKYRWVSHGEDVRHRMPVVVRYDPSHDVDDRVRIQARKYVSQLSTNKRLDYVSPATAALAELADKGSSCNATQTADLVHEPLTGNTVPVDRSGANFEALTENGCVEPNPGELLELCADHVH